LRCCWSGVEESFGGVGGYAKLLLLFVDPDAEEVLLFPPLGDPPLYDDLALQAADAATAAEAELEPNALPQTAE
jgi:hypothetical protein